MVKLRDLMTTDVVTVGRDAPLKEAARRMLAAKVSGLPVTDADGRIVGIITEADFVKTEADRRAPARAGLLRWFVRDSEIGNRARTVGEVMTTSVITLEPDADHTRAARAMQAEDVKRIPVVDDTNRLLGIVSRTDIMRALARPDGDILDVITKRVMREILWIDPALVDLICVDGNVSLRGRLDTRSDAELLIEFVKRVDGVISVEDGLSWEIDNRKVPYMPPAP